jgi:kynurenine formamidase
VRLIDLSHTIVTGMARYPGDEAPRIVRRQSHADHGYLVSTLEIGCHVGTHVDTPYHFLDGQPGLEALPLERFAGKALCLDARATLPMNGPPGEIAPDVLAGVEWRGIDWLILRTGWERHWGTPRYYAAWPTVSPALAGRLASAGLKGVGLDSPSSDPLDGRVAHDLFAAAGMVNVENLANLAALPAGPFELLVLPLKLAGAEGSPVRAVAVLWTP